MYWAGDGPDLGSVTAVVQRMKATGKEFHVFFTVVPGGTDADVFILKYASRHRDTIVSNDQFKDNAMGKPIERIALSRSGTSLCSLFVHVVAMW